MYVPVECNLPACACHCTVNSLHTSASQYIHIPLALKPSAPSEKNWPGKEASTPTHTHPPLTLTHTHTHTHPLTTSAVGDCPCSLVTEGGGEPASDSDREWV